MRRLVKEVAQKFLSKIILQTLFIQTSDNMLSKYDTKYRGHRILFFFFGGGVQLDILSVIIQLPNTLCAVNTKSIILSC